MKIKYILVFFITIFLIVFALKKSYALDENTIEELIDNDEINLDIILDNINDTEEVYNYIDLIDDSLIPTASFNLSDKLNDNYDFLTIFAINFILNNEKYYKNDIIIEKDYIYNDGINKYVTNKYIDINKLYNITYNILGKKDYYIINDYLKVNDNVIPLLLINDYSFMMELEKIIDIYNQNNKYEVLVKYKNIDLIYKYVFEKTLDRYIINNIEVY